MITVLDEYLETIRLVGIVDYYVDELGIGMAYLSISVPHKEKHFKTFKFTADNLKDKFYKPRSGDVIEFLGIIDPITGNSAEGIEFYGLQSSTAVKNRLYTQDWNLKLEIHHRNQNANIQFKLASRPRNAQ
ncbi:MAG TPA: hypothetical protein VI146_08525 [Nitrososphaeraceae archaeon]